MNTQSSSLKPIAYRFLLPNEIMVEGDEFFLKQGDGNEAWFPVKTGLGRKASLISTEPNDVRRPVMQVGKTKL